MADPLQTHQPIYQPIPVLEAVDDDLTPVLQVADEPNAFLNALPVPDTSPPLSRPSHPIVRALRFVGRAVRLVGSILDWLFGALALMIGLAALAALPVIQFLSLGYLLEAGGRVARSGRVRDGFIGVRLAARLGGVVVASWLLLLPVRFVSGLARSAQIIDPGGSIAARWRGALFVLMVVTALHIGLACARGGRLRYFLWPFNFVWLIRRLLRGGYYAEARDTV